MINVVEGPSVVYRMSGALQPSLFFLGLPDLSKLVCVTLSIQEENEEPRSKQLKTCRLVNYYYYYY